MAILSLNRMKRIQYVSQFKMFVPENVKLNGIRLKIKQLIEMDIPQLPESKRLDHFVARLRNLDFPEGIIVKYREEERKL